MLNVWRSSQGLHQLYRTQGKFPELSIRLHLLVLATSWEGSPGTLHSPVPVMTVLPGRPEGKFSSHSNIRKTILLRKAVSSLNFFPSDGPAVLWLTMFLSVCWPLRAEGGRLLPLHCPKLTTPRHFVYSVYSSLIILSSPCSPSLSCHLSKNVFYKSAQIHTCKFFLYF